MNSEKIVRKDNEEEKENKMATVIGHIEAFVVGDDFGLYKMRMEHFLSLNKISDDKAKIDYWPVLEAQICSKFYIH